jgi:hypothetical protein
VAPSLSLARVARFLMVARPQTPCTRPPGDPCARRRARRSRSARSRRATDVL